MNTLTLGPDAAVAERAPDKPAALQPHLLERITGNAHQTIDHLAERAAPHAQRIEEMVIGTQQRLHDQADQARALGQRYVGSLRGTVREHPLATIVVALAAGALIARLMRTDH